MPAEPNALSNTTLDTMFDAIIVGSGPPGGATVARELANQGQRVLVLEWGQQRTIDRLVYANGKNSSDSR